MIVTNSEGRRFYVRVVFRGDRFGLDDKLKHDEDDPLIEFYDFTHRTPRRRSPAGLPEFGPRGQFVSRYFARTLAEHREGTGICLDGGVSVWSIDATTFQPVLELARAIKVRP